MEDETVGIRLATDQIVESDVTVQNTVMSKVENTEILTTENLFPDIKYLSLPNHAPREIFSRKFLIETGTLSPNQGMRFQPFSEIYEQHQNTFSVMDRHKYFRCDGVELDISISSPVSLGGFLVGWWTPGFDVEQRAQTPGLGTSTFAARSLDWKYWISQDFVTLATADSESAVMELKWAWPAYVMSNGNTPFSNNKEPTLIEKLGSLGTFHLRFVNGDMMDQSSPSITYRIFARYVNPYLAAPRTTSSSSFEYQSEQVPGYMAATLAAGMGVSQAYEALGGTAGIDKKLKTAQATFNVVKPYIEAAYCGVVGCDEEGSSKVDSRSALLDNDQYGSHISVRQNVWGDTSRCKPDLGITRLGTGRQQMAPPSLTGSCDEIDIYRLCQRWCFQRTFMYDMNDRPVIKANVSPTSSDYGWMRFFSTFFRLWTGSIKYKFKCFGSPLITYQVSVTVNFDDNAQANSSNKFIYGNVFSKQVTIRGTTDFEIEVPYMRETPWCRTDMGRAPRISFSAFPIGTVSGSNLNVRLPVLVMVAAGDDFRYRSLRKATPGKPFKPIILPVPAPSPGFRGRMEKQGLIEHTSSISKLGEGISVPNAWEGTIRDMLARPSRRSQFSWNTLPGDYFYNVDNDFAGSMETQDNFDVLSTLFLFYSGSIDVKAQFDSDVEKDLSCFLADLGGRELSNTDFNYWSGGNGTYRTDLDIWPYLELQIPFVSPWPMYPLGCEIGLVNHQDFQLFNYFEDDLTYPLMTGPTSDIPLGPYFISAGEDFCLHTLLPPWNADILPNRDEYVKQMTPSQDNNPTPIKITD